MDKVLKLAKELMTAIEEERQKNKVMLKDIPAGGKFETGIGRGEYQLIVTYKIADETLIDAVKVVVM